MNKRIKNKIQERIWKSPIVVLRKYHCDVCNKDLFLQVHELYAEKTLEFLKTNNVFCPMCHNELKPIEQ